MNDIADDELDDLIARGLRQGTRDAGATTADQLADALNARRAAPKARRGTSPQAAGNRCSSGMRAALLTGILASVDRDPGLDVVATPEEPGNPFVGYEPGWHEIDPGPVPPMSAARLAFAGEELVVAGTPAGQQSASVFLYDPARRSWKQLPDPGLSEVEVVGADDTIVAVGTAEASESAIPTGERSWKTWVPGEGIWVDHGAIEVAPELAALRAMGSQSQPVRTTLLWTGERVIDTSNGSVLDPFGGTSEPLQMPDDLVRYTHLITSDAVWTGRELVATSWSDLPGLAWNGTGTEVREVSGLPRSEGARSGYAADSVAVSARGRVFLFERSSPASGRAAVYDPTTDAWEALPAVPLATDAPYCPPVAAAVGSEVLVDPCDATEADAATPLVLTGDGWVGGGRAPWTPRCCTQTWLGAEHALVTWDSDTDTTNNPGAPMCAAVVDPRWTTARGCFEHHGAGDGPDSERVPTRRGPTRAAVSRSSRTLTIVMTEPFDAGPRPDAGGAPEEVDVCARNWWSSLDPGTHAPRGPEVCRSRSAVASVP
ncbi:MAG: hypothetical protein R2716_05995 [Microthrixaceae bacterium]